MTVDTAKNSTAMAGKIHADFGIRAGALIIVAVHAEMLGAVAAPRNRDLERLSQLPERRERIRLRLAMLNQRLGRGGKTRFSVPRTLMRAQRRPQCVGENLTATAWI
jgi:hypothetical protein